MRARERKRRRYISILRELFTPILFFSLSLYQCTYVRTLLEWRSVRVKWCAHANGGARGEICICLFLKVLNEATYCVYEARDGAEIFFMG